MKIAIVHDWIVSYAGSERVVEQMINAFPDADLYSLVDFLPNEFRHVIKNKSIKTSFIQNLPFAKKAFRKYISIMPYAIEQFDLRKYDVVISSSHAVAKGVITGPDQLHICMCYSPMRYAWDLQHQYLNESGLNKGLKSIITKWMLHKIRIWDVRTAHGVDEFIAISNYIKRRIRKVYRRNSTVIYPPVYVDDFKKEAESVRQEYYFTFSRMVPYKRIDLAVSVFTNHFPSKKLLVIGDGPEYNKIKKIAGPNVELLGYRPFNELKEYLSSAKAFIFCSEEDFGIAPLEAQACGTPVIAFAKGGAVETINGITNNKKHMKPTGVFFNEQSEESLRRAIEYFEGNIELISEENCIQNADSYSTQRFLKEFKDFVDTKYKEFFENNQKS